MAALGQLHLIGFVHWRSALDVIAEVLERTFERDGQNAFRRAEEDLVGISAPVDFSAMGLTCERSPQHVMASKFPPLSLGVCLSSQLPRQLLPSAFLRPAELEAAL